MIEKTEALALRVIPFSRTSHIVAWLTADCGKITTVVKGACRPKSAFLGQYDTFYTCELLYYSRERNGLHIIKECTPLDTRQSLRTYWRSAACASYVSDVLARITPGGGHEPELYELATTFMDYLATTEAGPPAMFWFELKLAELLGLSPRLTQCSTCRKPIVDKDNAGGFSCRPCLFSPDTGGVLCRTCAERSTVRASSVSPDVLTILHRWQLAETPNAIHRIRCTRNQLLALWHLLGIFLSFHLDIMPASRKPAMDILTFGTHQLRLS